MVSPGIGIILLSRPESGRNYTAGPAVLKVNSIESPHLRAERFLSRQVEKRELYAEGRKDFGVPGKAVAAFRGRIADLDSPRRGRVHAGIRTSD